MAAPELRAADFVVDPAEERIVTFDTRLGETMDEYLERRAAAEVGPHGIGTFGGVRAGTLAVISGITGDLPSYIGVVDRGETESIGLFTQDRKVHFIDDDVGGELRRVAVEPNQSFVLRIAVMDIGDVQRRSLTDEMKQLYSKAATMGEHEGAGGGGAKAPRKSRRANRRKGTRRQRK